MRTGISESASFQSVKKEGPAERRIDSFRSGIDENVLELAGGLRTAPGLQVQDLECKPRDAQSTTGRRASVSSARQWLQRKTQSVVERDLRDDVASRAQAKTHGTPRGLLAARSPCAKSRTLTSLAATGVVSISHFSNGTEDAPAIRDRGLECTLPGNSKRGSATCRGAVTSREIHPEVEGMGCTSPRNSA